MEGEIAESALAESFYCLIFENTEKKSLLGDREVHQGGEWVHPKGCWGFSVQIVSMVSSKPFLGPSGS